MIAAVRSPDGLRLDLGSGFVKPPGFVGIDDLEGVGAQIPNEDNAPDVFMDLNRRRIPFADSSCDEIRATHFLEHAQLAHIFGEVFRLLRPGGTFFFVVPYANSAEGMFPGHQIFLTEKFFEQNLVFQRLFVIIDAEWDSGPVWEALDEQVRNLMDFDTARLVLFNVCNQMKMWAAPRKGALHDAPAVSAAEAAKHSRRL